MKIKIERQWAMPNKFTFQIQPIADLLKEELEGNLLIVDPCFELERILIVAHGGSHNDTLVTVEKKTK